MSIRPVFGSIPAVRAERSEAEKSAHPGYFLTTRWSLVLAAGADGQGPSDEALAALCRIYWNPVFALVRRHGRSVDDAEDLTQDFFIKFTTGNLLQIAAPERGRFRCLLARTLQNFLADAHTRAVAQKRGGGTAIISWDSWIAERPERLNLSEEALVTWPPTRLFDMHWAAALVHEAQTRLGNECAERGRRRVFEAARELLSADRAEVSYAELAAELGTTLPVAKRLVYGLRQRYRELLREEVAKTVDEPEEIDDELRYLCQVLAEQEARSGDA